MAMGSLELGSMGSGPSSIDKDMEMELGSMGLGPWSTAKGSMKQAPWSTKMGSTDLGSMGPEPWSTENTVRLLKLGSNELLGSRGSGT